VMPSLLAKHNFSYLSFHSNGMNQSSSCGYGFT
jgi:hypothetical protein